MLKNLKIGSRRSDLARLQAQMVGDKLGCRNYVFKESPGDVNLKDPLWKMPEMGVFTSFLRKYLISGELDLKVHSWKDLPVERDPDSEIVCTLPRADPRDLILYRKSTFPEAIASGKLVVLTSSPRRKHNLPEFLKKCVPGGCESLDIEFRDVRGNIQTRLSKLVGDQDGFLEDVVTGENFRADALVVAKAAIDRFLYAGKSMPEFQETARFVQSCLDQCFWQVLPLSVNPTAAAQGALAVEMLEIPDNLRVRSSVKEALNCSPSFKAVNEERRILHSLGGGCHQKIGCTILNREWGKVTFLRGVTDRGSAHLAKAEIDHYKTVPFLRARELNAIAQIGGKNGLQLFERLDIPNAVETVCEKLEKTPNCALYVSKHDALPINFRPPPECPVWTGGVQSWFNLASRGVWVNGSSDSLGETDPMDVDLLLNRQHDVEWIKLTHSQAATSKNRNFKEIIPTYELKLKRDLLLAKIISEIDHKTHFFFSSGSSFQALISLVPSLVEKFKQGEFVAGSGPGNTLDLLRSHLGEDKIIVSYNFSDFVRKVFPPSAT